MRQKSWTESPTESLQGSTCKAEDFLILHPTLLLSLSPSKRVTNQEVAFVHAAFPGSNQAISIASWTHTQALLVSAIALVLFTLEILGKPAVFETQAFLSGMRVTASRAAAGLRAACA